MLCLAVFMLIPFLWMISSSFKDSISMFRYPIKWIPEKLDFNGYKKVWLSDTPFALFYFNSVKVTLLCLIGTFFSCTLAGYGYARIRFKGRDTFFLIKLATIMIPTQVAMLPTFIIFKTFGLVDTHAALWLPFFFGQPFGTFLMRQYFIQVPDELSDSAEIDGAGHLRIYWSIAVPLVTAGIAVLIFLYFVWSWNYYEGPLIYLRSVGKYTLPMALKFFSDEFSTNYSAIMATGIKS